MSNWRSLVSESIVHTCDLPEEWGLLSGDQFDTGRVTEKYPMRINPYYASLIQDRGDPIWRQCVPDVR